MRPRTSFSITRDPGNARKIFVPRWTCDSFGLTTDTARSVASPSPRPGAACACVGLVVAENDVGREKVDARGKGADELQRDGFGIRRGEAQLIAKVQAEKRREPLPATYFQ